MIVHKFGGTSVGNAGRIASVADIIDIARSEGPITVVVSAVRGTTDRLIAGARAAAAGTPGATEETATWIVETHERIIEDLLGESEEANGIRHQLRDLLASLSRLLDSIAVLGELTARGHDAVVCYGERLSAGLLAAVLRARGIHAEAVPATELIVTDDAFGGASPKMKPTTKRIRSRIGALTEQGIIPVVTGYIAATEQGIPTTLGRSGSDYSAAIVAACSKATELRIWTDVDGILTADPNVVATAQVLRELSYEEAARLARFGAEVLHPRTVAPVIEHGIPLRIVNSFEPSDPGTLIVGAPSSDRTLWPAIISATELRLLRLRNQQGEWRLSAAIDRLTALSRAGIDVLMFSQSFSEQGLNLVVREADAGPAARVLVQSIQPGETLDDSTIDVAAISVVGFDRTEASSTAGQAFAALGSLGVPVLAVTQAAVEDSVSFCVPGSRAREAVQFLHSALGLEQSPAPGAAYNAAGG